MESELEPAPIATERRMAERPEDLSPSADARQTGVAGMPLTRVTVGEAGSWWDASDAAAADPAGGAPRLPGGGGAVQVSAFATGCATLSDARFGSICGDGSLESTDPLSHASIADLGKAVGSLFGALLLLAGILLDLRC